MVAVTLVCAPAPREVFEETFEVSAGATIEQAVQASGLADRHPSLDWHGLTAGVWGRAVNWAQRVAEGDRIELCRPLLVDPKVARRDRFKKQGSRGAGLFARRREGGKAGY